MAIATLVHTETIWCDNGHELELTTDQDGPLLENRLPVSTDAYGSVFECPVSRCDDRIIIDTEGADQ